MLPQYRQSRLFDAEFWRLALGLMLWGYFKKVVIADNAAVVANKIFALSGASFPVIWAGVFAFAVQIYADFSGYTDIARGTARFLGIYVLWAVYWRLLIFGQRLLGWLGVAQKIPWGAKVAITFGATCAGWLLFASEISGRSRTI